VTRRWGYRPDAPDARDRPLAALLGAHAASPPPASATVEHPLVGPKDQGFTGSCTGQAWSQALRLSYLRAGLDCPELSALFSYYANRAEFDGQLVDDGAYLRTGAAAAVKFGIATESSWPFSESRVNTEPGWSAFASAHDRRGARSYHRVDLSNADDVRRAIASGRAVVGGWDVDQAFEDFVGRGVITKPDPRKLLGGHALPIVAYGADGTFTVLNSWSLAWGKNGRGICDESWLTSGTDGWVVDIEGAP
jgi:C1A family cysteine protease